MLTNVPFKLPNSIRPLDVTMPIGSTVGFTNVDPNGNPITPAITNKLVNFGWEYVYHCHILGHEENDMMRPVVVAVPPEAPSLTVVLSGGKLVLFWTDNSLNETQWVVQRMNGTGAWSNLATINSTTQATQGTTLTYTDATYKANGIPYSYRVMASNNVGTTQLSNFTLSAGGAYPTMAASSYSVVFGPPTGTTNLFASQATAAKSPIILSWTYSGTDQTGFTIQRATNNTFTSGLTTFKVAGNVFAYVDAGAKANILYFYRVMATNFLGNGTWSNIFQIKPHP
jgi:hypothetical protein